MNRQLLSYFNLSGLPFTNRLLTNSMISGFTLLVVHGMLSVGGVCHDGGIESTATVVLQFES